MSIYYLGYYADEKNIQNRLIRLSAVDKMNYIIDTLVGLGESVTVVSASQSLSNKACRGEYKTIRQNVAYKSFFSFGSSNPVCKLADRIFIKLNLFFYLVKTLKKDDVLLVYHSPYYLGIVAVLKKIVKCKAVFETEEIYYNVSGDIKKAAKEKQKLLAADGFLFPTKLLDKTVNVNNKPALCIHGIYSVAKKIGKPFNDGRIHCVYAGTFDQIKGGAFAAISAAEHLNDKYHMHILGFGTDAEIQKVIEKITDVAKKTECKITYEGCLSGDDYVRFIQGCDVGLSCQNPSGIYNDTSFPSKILSYMSNGLKVVSVDIPAIRESDVSEYICYYSEQTPQKIADAIKCAEFSKIDATEVLTALDKKFAQQLNKLFNAQKESE